MTGDNKQEFLIAGDIYHIGEVQAYGPKNFEKALVALVLRDSQDEKWDQYPPFAFSRESLDQLRSGDFQVGDSVEIVFNIKGNRHKQDSGKFFPELAAKSIRHAGQQRHQKGRPARREEPPQQREYKLGKPRSGNTGVEAHWSPGGRGEEDDINF